VIMGDGVILQFEMLNICFTVWRAAVWGRWGVVMLQTHSRRQQTTAFSSNWLLKLIPNHITIPKFLSQMNALFIKHIKC
jgi:hypothetical protein